MIPLGKILRMKGGPPPIPSFLFDPSDVALATQFNAGGLSQSWGNRFSIDVPGKISGIHWNDVFPGISPGVFTWTFSLWRTSDQALLSQVVYSPLVVGLQTVLFGSPVNVPPDDYAITYFHSGNPANPVQTYFGLIPLPPGVPNPTPLPFVESHFTWLAFGSTSVAGDTYPSIDAPGNFGTQPGTIAPLFIP